MSNNRLSGTKGYLPARATIVGSNYLKRLSDVTAEYQSSAQASLNQREVIASLLVKRTRIERHLFNQASVRSTTIAAD